MFALEEIEMNRQETIMQIPYVRLRVSCAALLAISLHVTRLVPLNLVMQVMAWSQFSKPKDQSLLDLGEGEADPTLLNQAPELALKIRCHDLPAMEKGVSLLAYVVVVLASEQSECWLSTGTCVHVCTRPCE